MKNEREQLQTTESRELAETEGTRPGPQYAPSVDIFETEDAITVLADMPGVRSENLEIDLREGVLTLVGKSDEEPPEGETEVLREYAPGSFYRQFRLAEIVDQERIDAKLVDGVLTLVLPKIQAAVPRQITVKTA